MTRGPITNLMAVYTPSWLLGKYGTTWLEAVGGQLDEIHSSIYQAIYGTSRRYAGLTALQLLANDVGLQCVFPTADKLKLNLAKTTEYYLRGGTLYGLFLGAWTLQCWDVYTWDIDTLGYYDTLATFPPIDVVGGGNFWVWENSDLGYIGGCDSAAYPVLLGFEEGILCEDTWDDPGTWESEAELCWDYTYTAAQAKLITDRFLKSAAAHVRLPHMTVLGEDGWESAYLPIGSWGEDVGSWDADVRIWQLQGES